jgi:hypothetical protein
MVKNDILGLEDKETVYGWRTFKGVEAGERIFD